MNKRLSFHTLIVLALTAVLSLNSVAFSAPTLKVTSKPAAKKATPKPAAKATAKVTPKPAAKATVKSTPKPAPTINPLQAINDDLMISNTAYQEEVNRLNSQLQKLSELANQKPQIEYVFVTPEPTPVPSATPEPSLTPSPTPVPSATPEPEPLSSFSLNIFLEETAKNKAWLRGVEVVRLGEEQDGPIARKQMDTASTTVIVGSWNQPQLVYLFGGSMTGCGTYYETWKYCDRKSYLISESGVFSLYPNGVYYKGLITPSPTPLASPGPSGTPAPTLAPGQTPSPTPAPTGTPVPGQPTPTATPVPGQPTPVPTPTPVPGQPTPVPTPTPVPGQPTPVPTIAPTATPAPVTVSVTFKINYDTKNDGDIYFRTGSSDEKMTWTSGNVWTITKSFTAGSNVNYSFVHKYKTAKEPRVSTSRSYTVPSSAATKTDSW